jgi:hypothetical protein
MQIQQNFKQSRCFKIAKLATVNFVSLIYILLKVDSNEKLGGSGRTQLTSYCLALGRSRVICNFNV